MIGGKTGSSELSRFNQCITVKWRDSKLTYITLGSSSMLKRKEDSESLVHYVQHNLNE